MAFFQNDAGVGTAIVYVDNPNSFSVTYSLTTPNIASGGLNLVGQLLAANSGASISVGSTFVLDATGTDTNRGRRY